MSADFLYWLGSTVAQSVVALIAFGAFIGVWRRDTIWASLEPKLRDLRNSLARIGASKIQSETRGRVELQTYLRDRVAEYNVATDPDDRLAALAAAAERWLATDLPEGLYERLDVRKIQRYGPAVINGVRVRQRIGTSMAQLVRSGLGAFVLSLLLLAAAEPATAKDPHPAFAFAGFVVLGACQQL